MFRSVVACLIVAVASQGVFSSPVAADEAIEYQIDYHLDHRVQAGEQEPTLRFEMPMAMNDVEVVFARSDDNRQVEKVGDLQAGQSATVAIEQPVGTFRYATTIGGTLENGQDLAFELDLRVTVVAALEVEIVRQELDLEAGLVPIEVNQQVARVELEVFDEEERRRVRETLEFDGARGRLDVRWEPSGTVGAVRLTVHDANENWHTHILQPFWVEIPEQIIGFETGSATIKDSEVSKLEETRDRLQETMGKMSDRESEMQLFVVGYTDTVGDADNNLELSTRRAQSIGEWFGNHDIDIPIYYQGFGQEVLAVETPDETEEEKNRRAVYILGNAPPPSSEQIPRSDWQRVR